MFKKYRICSFLIIFLVLFILPCNISFGGTYKIGNEEKEGSVEDFILDVLKEIGKGIKEVTRSVVITIPDYSNSIYICDISDWTGLDSLQEKDKVNFSNLENKINTLHQTGSNLTTVILAVKKDITYEYLQKVIENYEYGLSKIENLNSKEVKYIFVKPF